MVIGLGAVLGNRLFNQIDTVINLAKSQPDA